jgi:hypothetical protein
MIYKGVKMTAKEKRKAMVIKVRKLKKSGGYVGARISERLQFELDEFAVNHRVSKTDILEFCVEKVLRNLDCQKEILEKYVKK